MGCALKMRPAQPSLEAAPSGAGEAALADPPGNSTLAAAAKGARSYYADDEAEGGVAGEGARGARGSIPSAWGAPPPTPAQEAAHREALPAAAARRTWTQA